MRTRHRLHGTLLALALAAMPSALRAQAKPDHPDSATARENAVKRQRQGAGLRVGTWQTVGLSTVSGATYSILPALEAYWQKGLDRHLALENGGGFWGRTQRDNTNGRISSYAVPMMSAIKLYPATGPEDALEPFVTAGAGVTIGVDDRNATAGGILGGSSGQTGTALILGLGLKGGGGLEYHVGRAFGLQVGVNYQWIHFVDQVGGSQDYKGPVIYGGLSYRFQY